MNPRRKRSARVNYTPPRVHVSRSRVCARPRECDVCARAGAPGPARRPARRAAGGAAAGPSSPRPYTPTARARARGGWPRGRRARRRAQAPTVTRSHPYRACVKAKTPAHRASSYKLSCLDKCQNPAHPASAAGRAGNGPSRSHRAHAHSNLHRSARCRRISSRTSASASLPCASAR